MRNPVWLSSLLFRSSLALAGSALAPAIGAAPCASSCVTPCATPCPTSGAGIAVGDLAVHRFSTPLVNGFEIQSLDDLRGKPVLVEFWGRHCPPCVGAAVPASLKLQELFGDDLQVLFVESQEATPAQANAFAIAQRWMGGRAMWTKEPPFQTGFRTLPSFVLLGNDGRALMKGNPLAQPKEIERLIAEQIKLRHSPPCDLSKALHTSWAEFSKGRVAKALELARALELEGDAALIESVRSAIALFGTRIDTRLARIGTLMDTGYFDEAAERIDRLRRDVSGAPDFEERVQKVAARLESPDLVAEREAARLLARLTSKFYESGGDPAIGLELEKFAETTRGTKAASRAVSLARLSRPASR